MHLVENKPKHQYTIIDGAKTHALEDTTVGNDLRVYVDNIFVFWRPGQLNR